MTAGADTASAELAAEAERRLLRAERMECLAALTTGLTHSFSNLLTSTLMSIDRALEVVPEGVPRQLLVSLEGLTREGLQMVRQLLWIARSVGEEQPLVFQPQYLMVEVKRLLAAAAVPGGSPLIATHYPADLWALRGDPLRFVQLLLALALEAARTAPPGASLMLHAANVPSSPGDSPGANGAPPAAVHYVAIQAAAHRAGALPPAAELPAGGPAHRRLPALSAAPGAWIVDRLRDSAAALAEAAGGVCRALPPETGGGLVAFLPAVAPEGTAPPLPVERLPRGAGERVLVFEDEPMLAAALCEVLGSYGYRAAAAPPTTALATTVAVAPATADLILAGARLDTAGEWQMAPGAAVATVPIMLMVDVETADRFDRLTPGERRGITPHAMLRKPFTSRELLQALAALPRSPA